MKLIVFKSHVFRDLKFIEFDKYCVGEIPYIYSFYNNGLLNVDGTWIKENRATVIV